jgi:hypothetical protein
VSIEIGPGFPSERPIEHHQLRPVGESWFEQSSNRPNDRDEQIQHADDDENRKQEKETDQGRRDSKNESTEGFVHLFEASRVH